MKAAWFVAVLLAPALAGCTDGDPVNPNLVTPKLVVQPHPDGNVTVFIHSQFGERAYEWIDVRIDNESVLNRTNAFSWEHALPLPPEGFFIEAAAGAGDQVFETRALVRFDLEDDRAIVSFLEPDGEWTEPRQYGLPFERLLDRRTGA